METCKNCNGWGMLLNGKPNPFMACLDTFRTNLKYEICRECSGEGYIESKLIKRNSNEKD